MLNPRRTPRTPLTGTEPTYAADLKLLLSEAIRRGSNKARSASELFHIKRVHLTILTAAMVAQAVDLLNFEGLGVVPESKFDEEVLRIIAAVTPVMDTEINRLSDNYPPPPAGNERNN